MKNKLPDCILYSEDGTEFKTHKEILGQTKFMRKLLKSAKCCGSIEIICPCSKEELGSLIELLTNGTVRCKDEIDLLKVFENLNKVLGFPTDFDSHGKFAIESQNDAIAEDDSIPTNVECGCHKWTLVLHPSSSHLFFKFSDMNLENDFDPF